MKFDVLVNSRHSREACPRESGERESREHKTRTKLDSRLHGNDRTPPLPTFDKTVIVKLAHMGPCPPYQLWNDTIISWIKGVGPIEEDFVAIGAAAGIGGSHERGR